MDTVIFAQLLCNTPYTDSTHPLDGEACFEQEDHDDCRNTWPSAFDAKEDRI